MFYLLKSEYRRTYVGDVLIDLNQVEAVSIKVKKLDSSKSEEVGFDQLYKIVVNMGSEDHWVASFKSLASAKLVVKEILGDKIDDQTLEDLTAHEC